ncbi:MAG: hypothetical protein JO007_21465 [Alphaproteobacteria bacterium]|nr:hypothetical protein [Alphaproteobacteria bacterium]
MDPTEMTEEEAALWDGIIAAEPPGWFGEAMKPLLLQYCRHITAAHTTAKLIQGLEARGRNWKATPVPTRYRANLMCSIAC